MSVTIACPKCSTRYKLPEQTLGKAIKCKSCGAKFRTKAPGDKKPASKAKAASKNPPKNRSLAGPSQQDLAEFGLDGQLKRQGDVFDDAVALDPRKSRGLNNFAAEDPGFAADTKQKDSKQEDVSASDSNDMSAVLQNPALRQREAAAAAGGMKQQQSADKGEYRVARIGMRIFSWTLTLTLVMIFVFVVLGLSGYFFPGWNEAAGESVTTILGVLLLVLFGAFGLSLLALPIGPILCFFSPQQDEKMAVGMTIGCLVVSPIVLLIGGLVGGGIAAVSGNIAGAVAASILSLVFIFASFLIAMGSTYCFTLFFKRIGQNIRSRQLIEAAKASASTWIAAVVVNVLGFIALLVVSGLNPPSGPGEAPPDIVRYVGMGFAAVSLLVGVTVMVTMLMMIKKGIEQTAGK